MYACRIETTMLSKTLSVLLAVYLLPDFSHGKTNQFRADYTYIKQFESYYKFHSTPKQWRDAKRVCSEEGASLFYPENNHEANAVISFWKQSRNNAQRGTSWVYIGMSDLITEGVYETIDGKPISEVYNNWNSDQPDDFYGEEDCVHMNEEGRLNDIACLTDYSFICKKSFRPRGPTSNCHQSKLSGQNIPKNLQKDYKYIEKFGSYYKFHSTPKPWRVAKRMCSEEGASLFYPENTAEANAVISYWKRTKNETQHGSSGPWHTVWMYVGMSDIITEGLFETIDGKSISEVYSNWIAGQPDNCNDIEDCVHMKENGVLNDIPCDTEFSFICKKSCQQSNYGNYNYIEAVDSFYKIHTTPQTFDDAKQTCVLEGASLFYPENEKEADAVIEFWNNNQPSTDWAVYVGLTDMKTEGTFQTVDGRPITDVYAHWRKYEPNNHGPGGEDCVILYKQGHMNDVSCDDKYRFICKRLLPQNWNNRCNMAYLDYTFSENIGNCYKVHTTPVTWTEAYDVCRAEQSHLAVINNALEADYLVKLTKAVAKKRSHQDGRIYHVGVHNVRDKGWQTVTGQKISYADALWANILPGTHDTKKCGSMWHTGSLRKTNCNRKAFFICEHELDGPTESTFVLDIAENQQ